MKRVRRTLTNQLALMDFSNKSCTSKRTNWRRVNPADPSSIIPSLSKDLSTWISETLVSLSLAQYTSATALLNVAHNWIDSDHFNFVRMELLPKQTSARITGLLTPTIWPTWQIIQTQHIIHIRRSPTVTCRIEGSYSSFSQTITSRGNSIHAAVLTVFLGCLTLLTICWYGLLQICVVI